jgi:sugar O-acyltransferase (sialic acid O-acetyltransferase NeuD family)
MADIIIYGASGHAKVIIDIIEQAGFHKIIGLVDDTGSVNNLMGYLVARDMGVYLEQGIRAGIVAIGDNWQRCRISTKILSMCKNFEFVTAIHPSVNITRDVIIGDGTVVMSGCNINTCSQIGSQCILNTGSNIDHDCSINDFASIAPGATLGGNVVIGEYSAVGLGASVIQKIVIGPNAVIGAGSVVIKDIPSKCVAFGNPCKFVRRRDVDESYL